MTDFDPPLRKDGVVLSASDAPSTTSDHGAEVLDGLLKRIAKDPSADERDAISGALMEIVADMIPTASKAALLTGVRSARRALDAQQAFGTVDETSTSYMAGRISAIVDILGYAAAATSDVDLKEHVRIPEFAGTMRLLAEDPIGLRDLAARLGEDEPTVLARLGFLRGAQMATSFLRGRETFHSLTPAGRLVLARDGDVR